MDGPGGPDGMVMDLAEELGPQEQRAMAEIRHPGRRLAWIAGRLAAKELARLHLRERYGVAVARQQLSVLADELGAPRLSLPSRPGLAAYLPAISITHAAGRAVALAAQADGLPRLPGVDLEPIEQRPRSFVDQWFTGNEQRLLARLSRAQHDEQVTRLWCLKQAVAKALGLGLRLAAPELQVDLAPDGSLSVQLSGAAARRFADLDGLRLQVGTERLGDAVLAWALVETRHLEPAPGSDAPWQPLCAAREARVHAPLRPGPAG